MFAIIMMCNHDDCICAAHLRYWQRRRKGQGGRSRITIDALRKAGSATERPRREENKSGASSVVGLGGRRRQNEEKRAGARHGEECGNAEIGEALNARAPLWFGRRCQVRPKPERREKCGGVVFFLGKDGGYLSNAKRIPNSWEEVATERREWYTALRELIFVKLCFETPC